MVGGSGDFRLMDLTFNANDRVTVRLTPDGHASALDCGWVYKPNLPPAGEPWTEQLWIVMRALGSKMSMAGPQLIVGNLITFAGGDE